VLMPGDAKPMLYPDPKKWAFTFWPGMEWPDSYGDGTNWLEGNAESQTYVTPFLTSIKGRNIPLGLRYNPFSIAQDGLHIKASLLRPEQQDVYQIGGHRRFGSGLLLSRFTFKYGTVRVVAKLPAARGSWPAFWLLPEAHKWPPEIDIVEAMAWGPHSKQVHIGFVAPKEDGKGADKWEDSGVNLSHGFHEYAVDWTSETLTYLFDGKVMGQYPTPASFNAPMYIIINLAVGGTWPYNELGILPIDGKKPERLERGASAIEQDYPSEMIVKSVLVEARKP
jgi:beta-glucanase (GH16 family)